MSNSIGGTVGTSIVAFATIFNIHVSGLTWVTGPLVVIGIIGVCYIFGVSGEALERKITKIINDKWHGIGRTRAKG